MEQLELVTLIQNVWGFILAAGGISALLVLFLGALKNVTIKGNPLVKDGMSDTWFKGLQALVLVGLTAFKLAKPEIDLSIFDTFAGDLANTYGALTMIVIPFAVRFGEFLYKVGIRKLPLFGKSFSDKPLAKSTKSQDVSMGSFSG